MKRRRVKSKLIKANRGHRKKGMGEKEEDKEEKVTYESENRKMNMIKEKKRERKRNAKDYKK